jgi:predicted phosphoadenosine phosphosulfate sulfurtransferase
MYKWGKKSDEGNVYEAATARMEIIMQDFDELVVSFSGGKDSTCVLNVAIEAAERHDRLPVRAVFFDEEAIAPDTEDYVRRVAQDPRVELEWYCVPIKHRNGASAEEGFWYPFAPEDEAKWCRPLPPEAITDIPGVDFSLGNRPTIPDLLPFITDPKKGRTAILLGIRADESIVRRKAVSIASRRYAWQITPDPRSPWASKCYPVYDWTVKDVWTAPRLLGWDYNRFYDILEMAGVSHRDQRCAPPFGDEPLRDLHVWQTTYPELWDRMVARVPGAATAARYANTSLYGTYTPFECPVGRTPQDIVRARIDAHSTEAMRQAGASAVRALLNTHYSKTSDPIMLNARHPTTGISWRILDKAAMTADLKARIKAMVAPGYDNYDRLLVTYRAEWLRLWDAGHRGWLPEPPSVDEVDDQSITPDRSMETR